jgi:hypothetical protein
LQIRYLQGKPEGKATITKFTAPRDIQALEFNPVFSKLPYAPIGPAGEYEEHHGF